MIVEEMMKRDGVVFQTEKHGLWARDWKNYDAMEHHATQSARFNAGGEFLSVCSRNLEKTQETWGEEETETHKFSYRGVILSVASFMDMLREAYDAGLRDASEKAVAVVEGRE